MLQCVRSRRATFLDIDLMRHWFDVTLEAFDVTLEECGRRVLNGKGRDGAHVFAMATCHW